MAKPGSTLRRFWMVRTNTPAPTMSSRLKPICSATQVRRNLQRSPGAGSSLLFEGLDETRVPELQSRRQAEEQAGDEGGGHSEEQNAPVEGGREGGVWITPSHPGDERC